MNWIGKSDVSYGGFQHAAEAAFSGLECDYKGQRFRGLGIRFMRQLNSAYLMKLGWRLLTEPSTLWSRVLKEKYGWNKNLNNIEVINSSCTNAWRGIMSTMKNTKQGMGMAIGDGRQTLFRAHRWLDEKILSDQALVEIPESQYCKHVCDYWSPNGGWD